MTVLGVMRQKQVIRLDETPDSPAFALDLSDKKVMELAEPFGKAHEAITGYVRSKGGDKAALANAYRTIVESALGPDAYAEILDYVTCGENDAENATIYMAPVATYILSRYADACTMKRANLEAKYLGTDRAD